MELGEVDLSGDADVCCEGLQVCDFVHIIGPVQYGP